MSNNWTRVTECVGLVVLGAASVILFTVLDVVVRDGLTPAELSEPITINALWYAAGLELRMHELPISPRLTKPDRNSRCRDHEWGNVGTDSLLNPACDNRIKYLI